MGNCFRVGSPPPLYNINKVEDTFHVLEVHLGFFFFIVGFNKTMTLTSLHAVFTSYAYASQKEKETAYKLQG